MWPQVSFLLSVALLWFALQPKVLPPVGFYSTVEVDRVAHAIYMHDAMINMLDEDLQKRLERLGTRLLA